MRRGCWKPPLTRRTLPCSAAAILLNGGTLQLDASATGASTLANAITDGAATSASIFTTGTNAIALSSALTFSGNNGLTITGSSPLTFSSAAGLIEGGTDTLTQNGPAAVTVDGLTGLAAQTLTFAGVGSVVLPNADAAEAGSITLAGGNLTVGNATSLGTGAVTFNSGTLQASAGLALANNFAFANNGSLNIAGTNALTLSGGGTLAGTDTVNVTDTAGATFSGIVSDSGSGANLAVTGTGTLNLTNADSFGGRLSVTGATVDVSTAAGALPTTTVLTVNTGGTLKIDETAGTGVAELGASPTLNLDGGTFTLIGSNVATTATSETIGAINVQSGFSTVNLNEGTGGNLTLTAASLNPTSGAAVNFNATVGTLGTVGDNLTFGTTPATVNSIIPYATVTSLGTIDFCSLQSGGPGQGFPLPQWAFTPPPWSAQLPAATWRTGPNDDVVALGGETVNSLIIPEGALPSPARLH